MKQNQKNQHNHFYILDLVHNKFYSCLKASFLLISHQYHKSKYNISNLLKIIHKTNYYQI